MTKVFVGWHIVEVSSLQYYSSVLEGGSEADEAHLWVIAIAEFLVFALM